VVFRHASGGATTAQRGGALVARKDGTIVIAGELSGDLTLKEETLASGADNDIFVAALTASGDPLWGKRFGGVGEQRAASLAITPQGALLLGGGFSGVLDFDGSTVVGSDVTVGATKDLFAARLTASGEPRWAVRAGSGDAEEGIEAVVPGANNAVYAAGWFTGALPIGGDTYTSMGEDDIVIMKLVESAP
jgi:hypothetical protein